MSNERRKWEELRRGTSIAKGVMAAQARLTRRDSHERKIARKRSEKMATGKAIV